MDFVPSMAAVSAAMQKIQQTEAVSLKAIVGVAPPAPALDPRSVYTLTPEAANAVLSLAQTRSQAVQIAEFDSRYGHGPEGTRAVMATAAVTAPVVSVEPTKSVGAANRNWNEDVRLEPVTPRKVGADLTVQYDSPRVMAAWSAAFPDVARRQYRGLLVSDMAVKSALAVAAKNAGYSGTAKDIYLLCNGEKFRLFSDDHPDTKINWINIDNDEIFFFWPKTFGTEPDEA